MKMAKPKDEQTTKRTPGPKNKFGLHIKMPGLESPHSGLIVPIDTKKRDEQTDQSAQIDHPPHIDHTEQTDHSPQIVQAEQTDHPLLKTKSVNEIDIELDNSRDTQPESSDIDEIEQSVQIDHSPHIEQIDQSVQPSSIISNRLPNAPMRDFTKLDNSITREIANGLFRSGKSLQVYNVLYSLTRGAIKPQRSVRITKPKLMRLCGVGSKRTMDTILNHFIGRNLLKIHVIIGERGGNEFEVIIPKELGYDININDLPNLMDNQNRDGLKTVQSDHIDHPPQSVQSGQKLHGVHLPLSAPSALSRNSIESMSYDNPNTSFKNFLNDDDRNTAIQFFERMERAANETAGKSLSGSDRVAILELAELFCDVTKQAAEKTNSVTSFVKFGLENLRRELTKGKFRVERTEKNKSSGITPNSIPEIDHKAAALEISETRKKEKDINKFISDQSDEDRYYWNMIDEHLKQGTHPAYYTTWFSNLKFLSFNYEQGSVKIAAADVTRDWIVDNYQEIITEALRSIGRGIESVEWYPLPAESSFQKLSFYSDEDKKAIEIELEQIK